MSTALRRGVVCAVLAWALASSYAQAAAMPALRQGDVKLSSGIQLHYVLQLPAGAGKVPAVMQYDPYSAASPVPLIDFSWVSKQGIARVGVNLPGTGCSTGARELLGTSQWGKAGAEMVEWIARQPWSDGHVGMVGISFPGLSQLGVAGYAPRHLDAIAPFNPLGDYYRDILSPGGLYNYSWTTEYAEGLQPALDATSAVQGTLTSAHGCAGLTAQQQIANVLGNPALTASKHPFFDAAWNDIPAGRIAHVKIPVLGCVGWEDGAVGSRSAELFLNDLPARTTWLIGNNGGHATCVDSRAPLRAFLDHYLKGVNNGWQKTPHILLRHEVTTASADADLVAALSDSLSPLQQSVPASGSWESTLRGSSAIRPATLHLGADTLGSAAPTAGQPPDSYAYPRLSSSNQLAPAASPPGILSGWQIHGASGGFRSYTSPPLTADTEFLGPASADLWVSSTATDTDLQVTVTDVRDHQEQYVQRGWLRLSHRKLNPARSTVLRPYQTHLQADAETLTPGQPVLARVEIMPFNHLFRKGSSIRLTIDAPTASTSGDLLAFIKTPATNTVHHTRTMDSKLVLGLVPASHPVGPGCQEVAMEPCRPDMTAIPGGSLTVVPDPKPKPCPSRPTCATRRVSR